MCPLPRAFWASCSACPGGTWTTPAAAPRPLPSGETALALFAPDDPFLGEGAKPGVHHLALAADDPARAAAALAQAGSHTPRPGHAMALDPAETNGVRLRLSPPLGLGAGRTEHAERIDHIGIASADNGAAIATFAGRLGLPVESQQTDMEVRIAVESFTSDRYGVVYHTRPPLPVGGLRVAFLTAGDCELEFLQNFDPDQAGHVAHGSSGNTRQDQGAIARFVASRGAGLHHVAFKAPDIDRTLAHLRAAGVPLHRPQGPPRLAPSAHRLLPSGGHGGRADPRGRAWLVILRLWS